MTKSPSDLLVDPRKDAAVMIDGAMSDEGLRIAWAHIWRAHAGNPPAALVARKDRRKAELEATR